MSYFLIYKTTNLINQKIYVGQHTQKTSGFDGYLGSGTLLNLAIKKYGIKNFIREDVVSYETKEEMNETEDYWITCLSANAHQYPDRGYNLACGGYGGSLGEEVNRKISKFFKGRIKNYKVWNSDKKITDDEILFSFLWSTNNTKIRITTTGEYFLIKTLEGIMKANVGDYVIKGIKGEVYSCREDIFKETYDL